MHYCTGQKESKLSQELSVKVKFSQRLLKHRDIICDTLEHAMWFIYSSSTSCMSIWINPFVHSTRGDGLWDMRPPDKQPKKQPELVFCFYAHYGKGRMGVALVHMIIRPVCNWTLGGFWRAGTNPTELHQPQRDWGRAGRESNKEDELIQVASWRQPPAPVVFPTLMCWAFVGEWDIVEARVSQCLFANF